MAAPQQLDRRTLRPAVFLEWNGVLNYDDGRIDTCDRVRWMPNAVPAILRLNDAGYLVFIVSDHPGVARGLFTREDVEKLHVRIRLELREQGTRIDDVRYCPYHPEATVAAYKRVSDWRKPGPGMIFDLMRFWSVELERNFLVGDKAADLEAAQTAGIRGHLLADGNLLAFVEAVLAA